jgi:hypothetical protein
MIFSLSFFLLFSFSSLSTFFLFFLPSLTSHYFYLGIRNPLKSFLHNTFRYFCQAVRAQIIYDFSEPFSLLVARRHKLYQILQILKNISGVIRDRFYNENC